MGRLNTSMMPVISGIEFCDFHLDSKYGLVVLARGDTPPGPARSRNASTRKQFWEQGKRLQQRGLVAIVTKARLKAATVSLALLTTCESTSDMELRAVPKAIKQIKREDDSDIIEFGLAFVSSADGLQAVHTMKQRQQDQRGVRLLLESPVLYERARPFLQALHSAEPFHLPLARYIKHGNLHDMNIDLPAYSTVPGFTWKLHVLLRRDAAVKECIMDPTNELSIASARETLYANGVLDPR